LRERGGISAAVLPIHDALPALKAALAAHGGAVLVAPPGPARPR